MTPHQERRRPEPHDDRLRGREAATSFLKDVRCRLLSVSLSGVSHSRAMQAVGT